MHTGNSPTTSKLQLQLSDGHRQTPLNSWLLDDGDDEDVDEDVDDDDLSDDCGVGVYDGDNNDYNNGDFGYSDGASDCDDNLIMVIIWWW